MKRLCLIIFLACPSVLRAQRFSYPVPPDSIQDRQGHIAYMAKYFWNKQGIGDTANFKGPKLLLDYLYLLKQSDERSMEDYANSFVSLACRQQTFGPILYWLDNILYDSASPHYDEKHLLAANDYRISIRCRLGDEDDYCETGEDDEEDNHAGAHEGSCHYSRRGLRGMGEAPLSA